MLHATMRGEMLQLCTTWARVLPSDPFFLWQDTRVSVHFRFRDTLYALSGLTGVSDADDSFRFEFDSVSRQRLQVLSRLLQDAGLLRSSELQTCASRQNDRSAAPPAKHEGPEDAKRDPVKYCSSEHNRRAHPRYTLATPAILAIVNGGVFDCEILELSLGGCRVQTLRPLNCPLLTRVEVEFVGLGIPLRLAAQIQMRSGDYVAGLKYLEVSPRLRERLSDLIGELSEIERPRD